MQSPEPSTPRLFMLATVATLIGLVAIEALARAAGFVYYGFSPYFLVYGFTDAFVDRPNGHTADFGGYFKFPPSKVIRQYGRLEGIPIRINNIGFRGPDFEVERPRDRFRIVAMGGSSTFGFYDRDEHTYPYLLEHRLRLSLPAHEIDVLNAGIPHADTGNVIAMLRDEILDYRPDVITMYAAYNNAGQVKATTRLQSLSRWMHVHSVTYMGLRLATSKVLGVTLGVGARGWAGHLACASPAYIARQRELHVPTYHSDIVTFVELVRSAGATPILIRQPMTSRLSTGSTVPALSYEGEIAYLSDRLRSGGCITPLEALVLIHKALIDDLDRVAAEQHVIMVDNVQIVDSNPDSFASQVHLTEAANARLADALHDAILPVVEERAATTARSDPKH